jgi:hypothetical protein
MLGGVGLALVETLSSYKQKLLSTNCTREAFCLQEQGASYATTRRKTDLRKQQGSLLAVNIISAHFSL